MPAYPVQEWRRHRDSLQSILSNVETDAVRLADIEDNAAYKQNLVTVIALWSGNRVRPNMKGKLH